jgi:hypothetical protein
VKVEFALKAYKSAPWDGCTGGAIDGIAGNVGKTGVFEELSWQRIKALLLFPA